MDGAMAEALAKAEGEQDMEKKIEAALACPCLGALPSPAGRGCRLRAGRIACAPLLHCSWLRACKCLTDTIRPPTWPCRGPEGGALRPCVCARLWLLHPQVRPPACLAPATSPRRAGAPLVTIARRAIQHALRTVTSGPAHRHASPFPVRAAGATANCSLLSWVCPRPRLQ